VIERHDSAIVTTFVRLVTPPAQLFALYVLAHGHYSPGGGFQAGVILAAVSIMGALALGPDRPRGRADERRWLAAGAGGVLLYLGAGAAGLARGGAFLDYAGLALGIAPVRARYLGILIVEVGVAVTVAAALVVIFARLADRPPAP
jgi:multicomponent Na+:H+ antiporter subunit B